MGTVLLRGFLGAQYPDQPADRADHEGYRAIEQGDVDALVGHQAGITERQPHGGLADAPAGNRDRQHGDQHDRRNELEDLAEQHGGCDRLHHAPGDDDGEHMHQQRQHRDFRAVNAAEQHAIGDHRTGVDVVGAPPVLQPRPRQPAEQKKSEAAGKGCEIDEQQAPTSPCGSVIRR